MTPSAASAVAIPAPIPRLPPVTNAVLPFISANVILVLGF